MASIGANSPFPEIWKLAEDMADRQFRLEQAELAQRNADRAFELRNNAVMPTAVPASRRVTSAVPQYNRVQPAAAVPGAVRTFGMKGGSIAPAVPDFSKNTPSNSAYAAVNGEGYDPKLVKFNKRIIGNIAVPNESERKASITEQGIDFLIANNWTQEMLDNTSPEEKAAAIHNLLYGQTQNKHDAEARYRAEAKANALRAKADEKNNSTRKNMLKGASFVEEKIRELEKKREDEWKKNGLTPEVKKMGEDILYLRQIEKNNAELNGIASAIAHLKEGGDIPSGNKTREELLADAENEYNRLTTENKKLVEAFNKPYDDEIQERDRKTAEDVKSLYSAGSYTADKEAVNREFKKNLANSNYYTEETTFTPDKNSAEYKRRQALDEANKAGDFQRFYSMLTPEERKTYYRNYDPARQKEYNRHRQVERIQQAKLNNAELQLQSDNEKLRAEKELRKFNMRPNDPAADAIGLVHAGLQFEQLPGEYKEALIQHENDVFGGSYLSDPTFENKTELIRETYKKDESLAPGYDQFARRIFSAENGVKVDKNGNIVPVYSNSGSSGKGRTFTVKSNLSDEELTQRADEYLTGNPEVKLSKAGKKMVIELMRSDRSLTPETAINKLKTYIPDKKGIEQLWDKVASEIDDQNNHYKLEISDEQKKQAVNEYRKKLIEQDNVDLKTFINDKFFKDLKQGKAPDGIDQRIYFELSNALGNKFKNAPLAHQQAYARKYADGRLAAIAAVELIRKGKLEEGLVVLRELDAEWKKAFGADKGATKGMYDISPYRKDIYQFETEKLKKELAELEKNNKTRIGRAWDDWVKYRAQGETLPQFMKRFGVEIQPEYTTKLSGPGAGTTKNLLAGQFIKSKGEESENYIKHIHDAVKEYDRIMRDLENREKWNNILETDRENPTENK